MVQDNIKVIVRVRPPLNTEKKQCVEVHEKHNQIFVTKDTDQKDRFRFDHVAGTGTKQIEMMELIGKPIADNYLSGYNATIFAYGQTGSGKTFTMKGCAPAHNMGLMPNIFMYLFHQFEQTKANHNDCEYSVKCTCLEIYKSSVRDLLDPTKRNLQIREDANKKGFHVQGLSKITCTSAADCLRLVQMATKNRHTDATKMNTHSSRSHLIFTVITTRRKMTHDESHTRNPKHSVKSRTSRLNLVDLAGSERQNRTKSNGDRLQEAKYINQSLSSLALVVSAVAASRKFIPFRDSALTKILKDSIGGNALTFMIANISPSVSDMNETVSTLRFAVNAKQIKNKAKVNVDIHPSLESLKAENSKFVHIVEQLTQKYKESEQKNDRLHKKNEVLQSENHSLKTKVEELKSLNDALSTKVERLKSNSPPNTASRDANHNHEVHGLCACESWVMVRPVLSPIASNRKRSHKESSDTLRGDHECITKKRKITKDTDHTPLSPITTRVVNANIHKYSMEGVHELPNQAFVEWLDQNTTLALDENNRNLISCEIERRLVTNPAIMGYNNQWINDVWSNLKEERTQQFIDLIFENECIHKLNASQLIEIMNECKMKRTQLKQLEQERKTRMEHIKRKQFNGTMLQKQDITNFEILLRITDCEESARRKLVQQALEK